MKKFAILAALAVAASQLTGCSSMHSGDSLASDDGTVEGRRYQMADGSIHTQDYWKEELEFPRHRDTGGEKAIVFNPNTGGWAAYNKGGDLVRYGIASGGADFCSDIGKPCRTTSGTFRITRKGGADCKSSKYPLVDPKTGKQGGAPMAYCMFFKGGIAFHASSYIPDFNASHGCVRMPHADAEWLNKSFAKVGTKVIVHDYID